MRQQTSQTFAGQAAERMAGLTIVLWRLARETRWLLMAFLAGYMLLSLASYHYVDPGWSHASNTNQIFNRAGWFGAWLADLLLYLFVVNR